MNRWETTGLLKWEDKNNDGRIQYYNDKNPSSPPRRRVGLAGQRDDQGRPRHHGAGQPGDRRLPNWVIALVAAGGLAAALSTAAGLLLAISSAISHDLLKGVFMPGSRRRRS
jgi:cation/acetate symporter